LVHTKVALRVIKLYNTTYVIFNRVGNMGQSIKISDYIIDEAKIVAKALNRSVSGQVEYWAKLGKLSEENPDLSYDFIMDILLAKEELKHNKLEEFVL